MIEDGWQDGSVGKDARHSALIGERGEPAAACPLSSTPTALHACPQTLTRTQSPTPPPMHKELG